MILIIAINFLGCQGKSEKAFKFDYTMKENYSEKISEGITDAFIDFTKDTLRVYNTEFKNIKDVDFKKVGELTDISIYMRDTVNMYEDFGVLNTYEQKIIDIMDEQRWVISDLASLKMQYSNYKLDTKEGKETEYSEEYFDEEIETLKSEFEICLKSAKIYMD